MRPEGSAGPDGGADDRAPGDDASVVRLFPAPSERVPLRGLYSSERFGPPAGGSRSFVYTNFIASLDGRISLPDARTSQRRVPGAIANDRDWRLFQELAACADVLLVSGQYVRGLRRGVSARSFPVSDKPEYADLLRLRRARGLSPQPAVAIVTASLDLPPLGALIGSGRSVYVATGEAADPAAVERLATEGVRVLLAGDGTRVAGRKLIDALTAEGHRNVAMLGGGEILHALVKDGVLDRLYLTVACRLLGGLAFDTLLTGPVLERTAGFTLTAAHYDAGEAPRREIAQLFAILDRETPALDADAAD